MKRFSIIEATDHSAAGQPSAKSAPTDSRNFAQKAADAAASFCGSWTFILWYVAITIVWCGGNIALWKFDRYPYQFYTFTVSVLAILMSSLILLAGNRQSDIDRAHAEISYSHVDEVNDKQDEQLKLLHAAQEALAAQAQALQQQHEEILRRLSEIQSSLPAKVAILPADASLESESRS